ncbi:Ig-like domain-containing protein [Streptosporangium canum]|uniref:Ig-like domain-containing protein n=1 Tax=Streptosporangium canum TaxID=324952 RepID=UPI0037A1C1A3
MNTHKSMSGVLARSYRRTSLIAVLGLSVSLLTALPVAAAPTPTPPNPKTATPTAPTPVNAAQQEAKKQNKRVEIESLRSESATYFANPDGKTLTTEFYTDPIRFKRDGVWQQVDTTLVADNGTIKPRATKVGLTLSPGGGSDLLTAASQRDGSTIKISAPQKLPAPKLSGNRAEYANAYGPGVDLAVIATPTGFRQEVIIRQRPVNPLKLSVPVQLPTGLAFSEAPSGKLALHDSDAKAKRRATEIPAPLLTDADANLSVGEEGRVGKVAAAVEKTAAGQALVYKPDASFLADPAVTYPLSLVVASTDWMQLSNANDTFINNSAYQNGYANSGAYHLQAGKTNEGTVRWRTYIRFDDITEDSPLRGGRVTNADLILWNIDSNDCGEVVGSGITARRITQRWDVSTLTWSNQPTVTSDGADTENGAYKPGCSRGYMNYEHDLIHYVNPIVQDWADGEPNYGFQLTAGNESDYTNWRAYRSKEYVSSGAAHGPKLVIGYEPAPQQVEEHTFISREPIDLENMTNTEAAQLVTQVSPVKPDIPATTIEEAAAVRTQAADPFEVLPEGSLPLDGENPEEEDLSPDEPPRVDQHGPHANATGVTPTMPIEVLFNEPVTDAQITVKDASGAVINGTLPVSAGTRLVTFTSAQPLAPTTVHTVEVTGATDIAGNAMSPYSWSFTTGEPDTTPPSVIGTAPADATTNVPVGTSVTATFNERVSGVQLLLKDAAGTQVAGQMTMDAAQTSAVLVPASPLTADVVYTAEVSEARDTSGNRMPAPHTWSFTIGDEPAPTPTPTPTVCAEPAWAPAEEYYYDAKVSWKGHVWQLTHEWAEPGEEPGVYAGWKDLGACGGGSTPTPTPTPTVCAEPAWAPAEEYYYDAKVSWKGHVWQLTHEWAEPGEEPGVYAGWEDLGACGGGSTPTPTPTRTYDPLCARSPKWTRGTTYSEGTYVTHNDYVWAALKLGTWETRGEPGVDSKGWESRGYCWSTVTGERPSDILAKTRNQAKEQADSGKAKAATAAPQDAQAQLAPPDFPYDPINFTQCWEKINLASKPGGYTKNSFNWCGSWYMSQSREKGGKIGIVEVEATTGYMQWRFSYAIRTVVGNKASKKKGMTQAQLDAAKAKAEVGARNVEVWAFVDRVTPSRRMPDSDGMFKKSKLAIDFEVKSDPGGACKPLAGHDNSAQSRTFEQWDTNPQHHFRFTSDKLSSKGVNRVATCTLIPRLYYDGELVGEDDEYIYNKPHEKVALQKSFRCDTSDLNLMHYGGCIFDDVTPTLGLSTADKLVYKGKTITNKVKDHAAHIKKAMTSGKKIPGSPDRIIQNPLSPTPLTRAWPGDHVGDTEYENRKVVREACAATFGADYAVRTGRQCDEYPFANTLEGAANGTFDYSVELIPVTPNTAAGATQRNFWERYRVLPGDTFYVKIYSGQPPQ